MSSGKVKCTCGWSWNKSDSSKKDMYICHECGRDNSNNMKNGGWLDNYADGGTMQEHQENYNDSKVSLPEGYVGEGYSTKGRNYSPAWGGQFQMGGEVPKRRGVRQNPDGTVSTHLMATETDGKGNWFSFPTLFQNSIPYADDSENWLDMSDRPWEEAYEEAKKRGEVINFGSDKDAAIKFGQGSWKDKKQMGGSIPGAVGFSYARTNDPAPSNGPYAKKTKASAQNGVNVDMYNNPITAIETFNPNVDRTFYDHRTNRMMLGNDYTGWIADENLQDKVKTHENYHAKQFDSGRYNYDIAHNTDQRQWAEMQKKPSMVSTSDVWGNYYDRKGREIEEDLQTIHENYPELGFVPDELLVDKIIDKEQYNNPYSMEGEAMYYENTGKDFYKLQNGGWLDQYNVAQDGVQTWKKQQELVKKEKLEKLQELLKNPPVFKKKTFEEKVKENIKEKPRAVVKENTAVKNYNNADKFSKVARNKTDKEIADERKAIREKSNANVLNQYSTEIFDTDNWTRQNLSDAALGLESEFRVSDEPNFFDDYLNPANMIGNMASNLGQAPLQAEQTDSYMPYITSIGTPLTVGALAGYGTNSTGQFVNNLVNPLAGLKTKRTSLGSSVDNVVNTSKNLEDLNYAKDWAQQYGYDLPENLTRISQSDELTNRTIRGMMNRHNTFVRGVSTNWDELAKKNPEILRHLEGKGFDLSTKEGTKAAAEYMATHVPIQTGYGRASLDKEVFRRGEDAIYTSNSIPTAEGYTYGQGYITKVKKPTDFSSANRQDWIANNNPSYIDEDQFRKMTVLNHDASNEIIESLSKSTKYITPEEKLAELKKRIGRYPDNPGVAEDLEKLDKYGDLFFKSKYDNKLLRTERSQLPRDSYKYLLDNKIGTEDMVSWLKQQPYTIKQKEYNDLGESLSNLSWEKQKPIRDKMDVLKKEINQEYNASVQEYMKKNHPDYDPVDRYSHYLHIGTPGEKILEPIKSWEITPEIWKNKSRAHSNTYSKKLSAMEEGGVIQDDLGQWAHPGEITEIGSNNITMEGVPYDVLGISDEGDTKLMKPGKKYKFKGKKVTEFPMAKNGLRQEQKGLVNLDNLTNFTNYNTKQPGGWLDQY